MKAYGKGNTERKYRISLLAGFATIVNNVSVLKQRILQTRWSTRMLLYAGLY